MSRCSIKSKEFKQRLNQRLYEREVEQRLQEEQRQRDKKLEDEKRKFQETVESLKYDWRKEIYPELAPQEPVKVVEERRVKLPDHLKYDWRKEIQRIDENVFDNQEIIKTNDNLYEVKPFIKNKIIKPEVYERYYQRSNWRDEFINEGMSTKDFAYLYSLSIYDLQINSVLGSTQTQNTQAQDIVDASADATEYAFGPQFPGSYANTVGDNQITSQSKVDVVAFLDTSYGDVSGTNQSYRLTTGPEGFDGSSGSVIPKVNLEAALGITLPSGVPNGALDGTPIEGSAIKRIFTDARPGRRINFNWTFASSEDALGAVTVDDYAFVAIKGNVTKFVSVLTKGLQYGGQFVYTVQPEDIVDGKVEVGIGVMDVYDPYIQTVLNISNFGSFWGAGTLGDTTDAADLGMSVAAANPNKKKKDDEIAQSYSSKQTPVGTQIKLPGGGTLTRVSDVGFTPQVTFTYDKVTDSGVQKVTTTIPRGAGYSQPVPSTPPKTQTPQKLLTPKQLADIDKQIKDLQRQSEKNKQDAKNNQWRAVAELGLGALQASTILNPIPGDEAVVAAALAVKTGPKAAGAFARANPGKYNPFLPQQVNKYLYFNLPKK